jgi:hypothetical protein
VLALIFLSVSVFILIFAKEFSSLLELDQNSVNLRFHEEANLNESPKNLFWFLQISDIHISKFKDKSRVVDFKNFCSEVFEAYQNPKVVIASGE